MCDLTDLCTLPLLADLSSPELPIVPANLWAFLPIGYILTVLLETPVLLVGLSRGHSLRQRLLAGCWLTACTYPVVILVMPPLLTERFGYYAYVGVAEVFAPLTECLLFWLAFDRDPKLTRAAFAQDMLAVVVANLVSWLLGAWLWDNFISQLLHWNAA